MEQEQASSKKMTFIDILHSLADIDNELVEFDPEQHKELFELKGDKIDNIVYFTREIEARIAFHKELIEERTKIKKALEASLDRFKKYVAYGLQSIHSKREFGNQYQVDLTHSTRVIINHPDEWINSETYAKYADVIERKFQWKKAEIKKDITKYVDIAKIEDHYSVKFGVRK